MADQASLTPEKAEALKHIYDEELLETCMGHAPGDLGGPVKWKEFVRYAEAKEVGRQSCRHVTSFEIGRAHV